MIDISTLNPAQLEAVTAPDGPVLVIAGAGSGKTRTIVHRLAWLAEQGVPASDMLLLTFTRKASREMLLRATDLLGYSIGGVHGGTFHSFAFSVLRQYRPAWAEGPVTVMDSADSASAIQQCKERLKVGKGDRSFPKTQTIIGLLSKARNKEISIGDVLQRDAQHLLPHADALESIGEAYRGYRRQQGLSELAHIASAYTDLEQFVADLSLETPEDDADEFDEAGRVVLSTIHSSKGLEWDAVILLDLVEDRFPSRHALVRPEDFEEERRLMYVACTRAREDLELFVPATLYSRQNGGNEPATPSPFVRELPFSALEEWQEGYTGRISKRSTSFAGDPAFSRPSLDIPRELANPNAGRVKGVFPPPVIPEAKGDRAASKGGAGCGYCRHKVFGRGKIVEQLPPDKCRVNFPGFGLKVILSAFLTLEE